MKYLNISDVRFYVTTMVSGFDFDMDDISIELEEEKLAKVKLLENGKSRAEIAPVQSENEAYQLYSEMTSYILKLFKNLEVDCEMSTIPLATFKYKSYTQLVAVELSLGEIDTTEDTKPIGVFETSRKVKLYTEKLSKLDNGVWCDHLNLHPYALVVASGVDGKSGILWSAEKIEENKKLLGEWIEYYSGHWEDYSEELYQSRIEGNLSNRLSELHYIRANSAFIYMEREDKRSTSWLHDYMQTYFVNQVLLSRAILFILMLINEELDEASERIRKLPPNSLPLIEKEVKFLEELNLSVGEIMSTLQRERIMNRLSHSTKVIRKCFEVFSLEQASDVVVSKLGMIKELASSEYQNVNEKLQKQQKRWVLILNALIGSQVMFTAQNELQNLDFISARPRLSSFIEWTMWGFFGALLVVSLVGLSISFLNRYTTWTGKEKKYRVRK